MQPDRSVGRRHFDHEIPPWIDLEQSDFFLTLCCQRRGTNQLCLPAVSAAPLDAARFYHRARKWFPPLFLLMPDHLHMIVSFGHDQSMTSVVSAWKGFTTRELGVRWQRGFFEHRLRDDGNWNAKAEYILQTRYGRAWLKKRKSGRTC